jgi:hypothetical protein
MFPHGSQCYTEMMSARIPARGGWAMLTCCQGVWRHAPRRRAAGLHGGKTHNTQRRTDGGHNGLTCGQCLRRQVLPPLSRAASYMCRMGVAATHKVVSSGNYTQRWSFLSIHWGRRSLLPKIWFGELTIDLHMISVSKSSNLTTHRLTWHIECIVSVNFTDK